MSLPGGPLVYICAVLSVTAVIGVARERGQSLGSAGDAYAFTPVQTPMLNDERPVHVVRDEHANGFVASPTVPPGDAVYLASPFAPSALMRPGVSEPQEFARIRIALPDGRQVDLVCRPGPASRPCIDAIRHSLGTDTGEVTAEARPVEGP